MQEQFVKLVLSKQQFEIRVQESCGSLLQRSTVKQYFTGILNGDEKTYDKMRDYTLKVNDHKHKGEKNVQLDTVINYLRIFHNVSAAYTNSLGIDAEEFDADYYASVFGIFEKENEDLKKEMETLKEELSVSVESGKMKDSDISEYKGLLSRAEIDKLNLEEQNSELHKQISKLKDIKLSSMEDKLNRTIEMLLSLKESVIENRAISYAVGDTICGREMFNSFVERAKESIKNG